MGRMTLAAPAAHAWTVNSVGVWSPCGTGNLGNEMTMAALVQNLRRLHPDVSLCAFSERPPDTSERYGIRAFPMMRPRPAGRTGPYRRIHRVADVATAPLRELDYVRQSREALKGLDLLVFAGTGILTDSWGGAARFPYNVLKWARLSRLAGARVAFVSVGAGPLDSGVSRWLIRKALAETAYRSFRDERSRALVEGCGVPGPNVICPDLAFSLAVPRLARFRSDESREIVVIGLPYRKPGQWENPSAEVYDGYLRAMAGFTSRLLDEGYIVRLVPTHVRVDATFIADLRSRMGTGCSKRHAHRLVAEPVGTFEQLLAQLAGARIVVSSRFHGVVFAYLLGIPVLGVSYHQKMDALMESFGQEEHSLPIEGADSAGVYRSFERLEARRREASRHIQRTVDLYRDLLERQYQTVLQL